MVRSLIVLVILIVIGIVTAIGLAKGGVDQE